MTNITLLGIDIAKNIFQLHGVNKKGELVFKKRVKRAELFKEISKLTPCTIAMEACGTSHYWGRTFLKLGHQVKLISPQFVKPFVKTNKNDKNDAAAIVEAASRPSMHFVSIKSEEKQIAQSIHRRRSLLIKQRTALVNHIRGLLAEFGICIPQKINCLMQKLVELLDENLYPDFHVKLKILCQDIYDEIHALNAKIKSYDSLINEMVTENPEIKMIKNLKGVGPISATMAWIAIGDDPSAYKNGRQFSASIGLVPSQHSSGNKISLGRMSKRGDRYLRQLLIHGARSAIHSASKKDKPENQWIRELVSRRGFNIAAVAVANKTARNIWRLLANYKSQQDLQAAFV